ncbi:MAG: CDP-alcohol phosphatidyltransferase family protein [Pseudomonadota bacterium]
MGRQDDFAGDRKVGQSLLTPAETALKNWLVPKIPPAIETWHLTLTTVLWSAGVVLFGYLTASNRQWVWMISLMIILQYLTDLADGEVGRRRNTGLIKWGFYMDHFLDYLFLCCLVFAGYLMAPAGVQGWFLPLIIIMGGFMVNSFLCFAATNQFEIYQYGLGPTESRIGFILINAYIAVFGFGQFYWLVPLACAVSAVFLIIYTWQIHNKLWALDMDNKYNAH